jgi:hypothetical protein
MKGILGIMEDNMKAGTAYVYLTTVFLLPDTVTSIFVQGMN